MGGAKHWVSRVEGHYTIAVIEHCNEKTKAIIKRTDRTELLKILLIELYNLDKIIVKSLK